MKPVIAAIARLGSSLHPLATVSLVLVTNVFWVVTLRAFGASFERIAGVPVLDLQNTQGILSPDRALELINAYSDNAVTLYWTFFVVDNFVPLLSFGSFALLWAFLLLHSPFRIGPRLARSWMLLLPFGVGLFDIGENLLFVSAITAPDLESQRRLLALGLVLVRIKASFLFVTFTGTVILTAYYTAGRIAQGRTSRDAREPLGRVDTTKATDG